MAATKFLVVLLGCLLAVAAASELSMSADADAEHVMTAVDELADEADQSVVDLEAVAETDEADEESEDGSEEEADSEDLVFLEVADMDISDLADVEAEAESVDEESEDEQEMLEAEEEADAEEESVESADESEEAEAETEEEGEGEAEAEAEGEFEEEEAVVETDEDVAASAFIDSNADVQAMRSTIAQLESELSKVKAEGKSLADSDA